MSASLTPDLFANVLADVRPRLAVEAAIIRDDDDGDPNAWTLALDNDILILAEWVDGPSRVVLSAGLGRPSEAVQLEVLEMLLSYNAMWRETDGVKAAQGGDDGELLLIYEWSSEDFSREEVLTVLQNFASLTRWWRRHVSGEAAAADRPPMGLNEAPMRI